MYTIWWKLYMRVQLHFKTKISSKFDTIKQINEETIDIRSNYTTKKKKLIEPFFIPI